MQKPESKAGENFKGVTHSIRSGTVGTLVASVCSKAESSGHPGTHTRLRGQRKPWTVRMQRTMGKPHGQGDFVGDQKEGTEPSERRKMLEREQIINGTRTRCWGSRGWREERVVLLFSFSHLHKTCFHTDLALLKTQHLAYHLLPTWNGTGKPQ